MKKIKAAAREGASPQPPNKSDDIDERKRSREVIATENAFIGKCYFFWRADFSVRVYIFSVMMVALK